MVIVVVRLVMKDRLAEGLLRGIINEIEKGSENANGIHLGFSSNKRGKPAESIKNLQKIMILATLPKPPPERCRLDDFLSSNNRIECGAQKLLI